MGCQDSLKRAFARGGTHCYEKEHECPLGLHLQSAVLALAETIVDRGAQEKRSEHDHPAVRNSGATYVNQGGGAFVPRLPMWVL